MEISNLKTSHSYDRINKKPPAFNGLLELSAGVQNNAVLNRAMVDAGASLPWVIFANTKEERNELARACGIFFSLAFIAPILNVPAANRLFMWVCGLTNGWSDNNHKAIQLSNKYLTSDEKLIEGLNKYNIHVDKNGKPKISERFFSAPIDKFFKKIRRKELNDKVNIQELLKKCGGDVSLLRKRISRAKNLTLCSDLIITSVTLGFYMLFNNNITKKKTGRTGYSAEFNMADNNIISERVSEYEKNKKRNVKILLAQIALTATLIPLIIHKGVLSKSNNAFTNFVKKHCKLTDYRKGNYMTIFVTLLGMLANISGLLLFSRNKTERRNYAIRLGIANPVMFGGDALVISILAKACDKIFKTDLIDKSAKKGWFRKIFPKYKSLEQISNEIDSKIISNKNKKFALSVYWFGLLSCISTVAFVVPSICNKLTKKDVTEYVQNRNKNNQQNTTTNDKTTKINEIDTKGIFKEFIIKK